MQPLAAYYLFSVNEEARKASRRPKYRSIPPKRTVSTRAHVVFATIFRTARHSSSAA
jgi:hypothetical protein